MKRKLMKRISIFLGLLLLTAISFGQTTSLVSVGSDGKLDYNPDANGNVIPDFSYVGYHHGEKDIPSVDVALTISEVSGDDLSNIQNAIDQVAAMSPDANGHKGAVLLNAGTYEVNGTIELKSGVVLRGVGNGSSETDIIATKTAKHDLISVAGNGGPVLDASTRTQITDSYVPIGARTFNVESGHTFQAGDRIILERKPNQAWIDALGMDDLSSTDPDDTDWTPYSYTIESKRMVVAVDDNSITIDAPVVDHIEDAYADGFITKYTWSDSLEEAGIENLRLESEYSSNTDEDHGWDAIEIDQAENCWVKDVKVYFFGNSAVNLDNGAYKITVDNCEAWDPKSITTGGRKYAFDIDDSDQCLFKNCYANSFRHDFVTESRTPGPHVFFNCTADNSLATNGPHQRWATGILYDNVSTTDDNAAENRKNSGGGHGWAGAQIMFWNGEAPTFKIQDPPMDHRNWAIGCIGTVTNENSFSSNENLGVVESTGTHIADIPSLYEAQLDDRIGTTDPPSITTDTTLNPDNDAYIRGGSYSTTNFGTDVDLIVKTGSNDEYTRKTYLRFIIGDVDTAGLESAVIRLYANNVGDSYDITIYETINYHEDDITWDTAPAAGTAITSTTVSGSGQYYEWDVTSYLLDRFGNNTLSVILDDPNTNASMTAFNSKEAGSNIPELTVTYAETPSIPDAPTNLTATATSSSQIDLSWTDNSDNEDGFYIQRETSTGSWMPVDNVGAGVTSYSHTGREASTEYTYRVAATLNSEQSDWSNLASATTFAENPVTADTVLYADNDAYVRGGSYSTTNFGSDVDLLVKTGSNDEYTRKVYLRYIIGDLDTANLESAVIRIYANSVDQAYDITAYETTNWHESDITWDTAPAAGNIIGSTTVSTAGTYYEWDVTSYLRDRYGNNTFSVVLLDPNTTVNMTKFNSKETGANIPELSVSYSTEQVLPNDITLNPDNDAYIRGGSYSTTNFGTDVDLKVKTGSSDEYTRKTYLRFIIDEVDTTGLASALIRLYANTVQQSYDITMYETTNWHETDVTWDTAPAAGTAITSTTVSSSGQYYEWDVTSYLLDRFGNNTLSVVLDDPNTNTSLTAFNSKEAGSNIPEMVVSYGSLKSANLAAGIEEESISTSGISIYPNPVKDQFTIDLKEMGEASIAIYDLYGQLLYSTTTRGEINLSTDGLFTSGIYLVVVKDRENNTYTKKILVR